METSKLNNFRLEINLSSLFNDIRRKSIILVNRSSYSSINDLKNRIRQIFHIEKPFSLLLNGTHYLPENEFIEILREYDTIYVQTKAPLDNTIDNVQSKTENNCFESNCAINIKTQEKKEKEDVSKYDNVSNNKQMETSTEYKCTKQKTVVFNETASVDQSLKSQDLDNKSLHTYEDTKYLSFLESTQDGENELQSETLENENSTSNNDSNISRRKRIRKRKNKTQQQTNYETNENINQLKKPRIVDSFVLGTGKHIRFEKNTENNINNYEQKKSSPLEVFSALLSLRDSSTPITFSSKNMKNAMMKSEKISNVEKNINGDLSCSAQGNNDFVIDSKTELRQKISFENNIDELRKLTQYLNPENCPGISIPFMLNDIVGFKVLKIGPNCNPEVSNYVIAKVINIDEKNKSTTYKILHGMEELKVQTSKFSFTEEEEEEEEEITDIFTLSDTLLIEPKLMSLRV